jgi:PAS domain S-box-containing protein
MGNGNKISLRDSIATRMLLVILGLYLLVAMTVTLSHVWMEYKYQKENILQDLGDIEHAFENGLAVSLWGLDQQALKASVEGMLRIPTLVGVKISNSEKSTIAIGGIVTEQGKTGKIDLSVNLSGCRYEEKAVQENALYNLEMFEHRFPITYEIEGKRILLGQVSIYSNSSIIYRRMKLQVVMLSANVVLTLLTFSMTLLWVVNRYLRRPLGILTTATEDISLNNLESFSIDTMTSGRNEIKVLEESMNFMVTDLHDAILKRNETEASLRGSEQYLRSIFRASPIGIGVSADRVLIQLNEQIYKMTGYTEKELIGQSTGMLYQSDDDYNLTRQRTYRQIQDQGTGVVETCWKKKNDGIINVLVSSTPLDRGDLTKGVTFAALDITKRKAAELALWKSEKKYRTLFEKSNDAIFIVEKNTGRYLDANNAASVLTGRGLKELKQMTTQDITPQDSHKRLQRIKGFDTTGELGTVIYSRPDNSHRFAKLSIVPLDEMAVIGIARDITDDLKIEQHLRQSQKMESIGTLAGGIAHDFNNILFPILGYTEMLREDIPESSPFINSLNKIHTGALRARALVQQILTFSRQGDHELKQMKIQPIIKEALRLIRSTIPATIDIQQDIQADCGKIKADPTQIHQIIMNLTTNAYHAMEETGG